MALLLVKPKILLLLQGGYFSLCANELFRLLVAAVGEWVTDGCFLWGTLPVMGVKGTFTAMTQSPFYAFKGPFGTDGAFGGVRVNQDIQAYRSDRKGLIEGLYVTGDLASGRHVNVSGVKWQVLNDLSWAFSSGFQAGTNVAKYLQNLG